MCNGITIGGNVSIQISGPCAPADGSVTAAKINSDGATDGQVLTANGAGGAAWEEAAGGGPGYLEYVALLTQSGTSAPMATVLKNTLGGTIVWTRLDVGRYLATLLNAFTLNKTLVFIGSSNTSYQYMATEDGLGDGDDDLIYITTAGSIDNLQEDGTLLNTPIEIRVYP